MTTPAIQATKGSSRSVQALSRYVPSLIWLRHYQRADLPGDVMAGLIVAIMLVLGLVSLDGGLTLACDHPLVRLEPGAITGEPRLDPPVTSPR